MEDKNKATVEETCEDALYARWFKCSECGCEEILDTFIFCPICGKRIDW